MDDRIEPDGPGQAGFRSYTGSTLSTGWAGDASRAKHARETHEPWMQDPPIRRHEARGPQPDPQGPRRSRLGLLVTGAAALGAVAIAGLLIARPDLRASGQHASAAGVAVTPSPPLQTTPAPAPAPASTATRQALNALPSQAAPSGVGLETLPPPPPLPPLPRRPAVSAIAREGRLEAPSASAPVAPYETGAPAAGGDGVRVFVHIADAAQMPAADRVRANLNGLRFGDQAVATPPVRLVAGSPRRTEVRCLKHADCPAARRVAQYVARGLGTPVFVVDMSPTYEDDRRVRAGSLELWLQP